MVSHEPVALFLCVFFSDVTRPIRRYHNGDFPAVAGLKPPSRSNDCHDRRIDGDG